MLLEELGFNQWFQTKIDSKSPPDWKLARVITVDRERYMISGPQGEMMAEVTGKLMFSATSPLDFPTVGDWVYAQYYNDDSFAVIQGMFPRKTLLTRKTSGKRIEHQLVAANVDTAFIVQSLDGNFNLRRLERYLAMSYETGIEPVILLNKQDLLSPEEVEDRVYKTSSIAPG